MIKYPTIIVQLAQGAYKQMYDNVSKVMHTGNKANIKKHSFYVTFNHIGKNNNFYFYFPNIYYVRKTL